MRNIEFRAQLTALVESGEPAAICTKSGQEYQGQITEVKWSAFVLVCQNDHGFFSWQIRLDQIEAIGVIRAMPKVPEPVPQELDQDCSQN